MGKFEVWLSFKTKQDHQLSYHGTELSASRVPDACLFNRLTTSINHGNNKIYERKALK